MTQTPAALWTRLMIDSWTLGLEASQVMWLRSMRLMGGGALAEREASRMMSEKWAAGMTLLPFLALGGMGQSAEQLSRRTLDHYSPKVKANRRRLSRTRR